MKNENVFRSCVRAVRKRFGWRPFSKLSVIITILFSSQNVYIIFFFFWIRNVYIHTYINSFYGTTRLYFSFKNKNSELFTPSGLVRITGGRLKLHETLTMKIGRRNIRPTTFATNRNSGTKKTRNCFQNYNPSRAGGICVRILIKLEF